MGIIVEFNPDLALRNIKEAKNGKRKIEECIPKLLEKGKTYSFLKKGQRNYWLSGEVPLVETKGNQNLSRPIASVTILEVAHFMKDKEPWTKGTYQVEEIFNDNKIHFDGFAKI
jgi:hypothetical protein